ncbi:hypothetical protein KJA13_04360 [Patescibacteria group bacterium]|nr:hypothetical protein [Patescibacteria group bacterium]
MNNINNKKECKICLWRNNIDANYCEQCGYGFVNLSKIPFLSKFLLKLKCKHINQKFRHCSVCGHRLNYHYKIDLTDNWMPTPYIDKNIEKIRKSRKKWYQFWR